MDKLKTTLELIRNALNSSLQNISPRDENWVVLSNVVDNDGRPYEGARNAVTMFLANIQNETVVSTYRPTVPAAGGDGYVAVAPPLYLNLQLLFYANFADANYPQGLALISRVISFFQQNPTFTHANLPGLNPTIDKLAFELVSLDLTDLNYLMSLLGTKYLPSVLYKVRLIPFAGDAIQSEVPTARGGQTPASPKSGQDEPADAGP